MSNPQFPLFSSYCHDIRPTFLRLSHLTSCLSARFGGDVMPTLRDSAASTACMEHQVFEHIKQALLVTLNWQTPSVGIPRKLSSLQFTIKSFQRHLERVLSVEEEGGYMTDAMETKPYLQDRVEQLAKDHARYRDRLRKLMPE